MTGAMGRIGRTVAWTAAAAGGIALHVAAAVVILRPTPIAPPPVEAVIVDLVPAEPPTAPGFVVPDSPLPRIDPQVAIATPQPILADQPPPDLPQPDAPAPDQSVSQPDTLPDPTPRAPQLQPPAPPPPVAQALAELPPVTPQAAEPPPAEAPAEITLPDLPALPDLAPLPPVPADVSLAAARPRARPETLRIAKPEPEPQPDPQPRREQAQPKTQPQAERQQQARQAAAAQQQKAQAAAKAAARSTAQVAAKATAQATASWQSRVLQLASRHMARAQVPTRARFRATLSVSIDAGGRVSGVSLVQGSGDARVDNALIRHARRLPSMPAPPDGRPHAIVAPFVMGG